MYTKLAIFTVVVFLAQPCEIKAQYSPIPLVNDIIKNFVTSANATLQAAINQTAFVANQFYSGIKAFEAQVQSNVTSLLALIDKQVETEIMKIGGLPAKVYNCTKKSKTDIDNYAVTTFNNLTGCATEKIMQGVTAINNIFTALTGMYNTVFNATNRINAKCPVPASAGLDVILWNLGCVTATITEISIQIAGYALSISANGANLGVLIASIPTFPTEFATCISIRSATALANIVPIAGTIALCTIF